MIANEISDPVLSKIKRVALRVGKENGIRGLSRAFRIMDDDGDQKLDKSEFLTGMRDYGIELTPAEADRVFAIFDKNRDGTITATEFICAIRGGLSPLRLAAVQRVFAKFDRNSDGMISVDDLRGTYDVSCHPKVLNGEASEEEVLTSFLNSFEPDESTRDGVISRQEFEQYYAAVSANIDTDEYFLVMMNNCWKLSDTVHTVAVDPPGEKKPESRSQVLARNNDTDAAKDSVRRVRAQLLQSNLGLRGIGRLLRRCDREGDGYVSAEDLHECMYKCRLTFSERDVGVLSRVFGLMGRGVDIRALMLALVGTFPPTRKVVLERTWRRFPRNRRDEVDVVWLQDHFVHRMMPQVVLEETSAARMLSSFLDVWDVREAVRGVVTYAEFEEAYVHISEAIKSDQHFETMMQVTWKV
eukprot:PhM_4_TR2024/c0_g1_i1/m.70628